MTQLSPDAITDAWLARNRDIVHGTALAPEAETTGIVEHVADGIAQVSGLPETRLSELLSFAGGRLGFALTLDAETIGPLPALSSVISSPSPWTPGFSSSIRCSRSGVVNASSSLATARPARRQSPSTPSSIRRIRILCASTSRLAS